MEKLSSILPASPRVKSVDMSDAKPRRPGAPSFGAPMGTTSSVRDRVNFKGSAPQEALQETLTYRNPKEFKSAKIAEQVTKRFFETRLKPDIVQTPPSEAIFESLGKSLEEESTPSLETVAGESETILTSSKQAIE